MKWDMRCNRSYVLKVTKFKSYFIYCLSFKLSSRKKRQFFFQHWGFSRQCIIKRKKNKIWGDKSSLLATLSSVCCVNFYLLMTCEKKETCYIHFTVIFIERCLYLLLMAYIDLENLSSLTCEKNYISLFFILL